MQVKNIDLLLDDVARIFKLNKAVFKKYFLPRIQVIINQSRFFILEEEYTEREWKELVSLHYIHTSYKPSAYVIRIHFLKNDVIEASSYIGFVNIRPINEVQYNLSLVYPNWKELASEIKKIFGIDKLYVMTYKKHVHVCGKELVIDTFPFFPQDGVVTRCAHAALVMVTKYVQKTLGHKLVKLSDIITGNFIKTKLIPSEGLTVQEMVEILNKAEIPVKVIKLKEYREIFQEWMDSYIESGIPVILTVGNHVITIIGHSSGDKKYLIYDDSGEFFRVKDEGKILKEKTLKNFVDLVSWDDIQRCFGPEGHEYMIAPEMEKVFVPFPYVKENFDVYVKDSLVEGSCYKIEFERYLIIDNSKLKKFLSCNQEAIVSDENKTKFKDFIESNLSHYLWFCEVEARKADEKFIFGFLADPTKHQFSWESMFYDMRIPLGKNKRIGLLTEF